MVRYLHIKKRTIYFVFIFIIRVIWYDICISIYIRISIRRYTIRYVSKSIRNASSRISALRAPRLQPLYTPREITLASTPKPKTPDTKSL